ncbi:MAG: FtsX-like permease family protein [Candidatus Poribacteria bacterium]|nr:FtsX-like permease family protein [Candidatus Poribacteria bacterium]
MHRFSWNALKHFWQIHLTVALCTAVATGVLAGALLVGDSVRGSLRSLTTERLGTIQHALLADHFFQPNILDRQNTVPTILLNGTVVAPQAQTRASKVNVIGVTEDFFTFWVGDPVPNLNKPPNQPFNTIVINEALQSELKVQIGDMLLVNVAQVADIHPEFLLGERDAAEAIQSLRLVISDIVPTKNAGRFNLRAHQNLPFNAFIALPTLQKALGQVDQVNALFTAETTPISSDQLTLTLEALDLNIQMHRDHLDLQSRQYLLKPVLSESALTVATENSISTLPTLTYLANTISANDRTVPYSTIVAFPTDEGEFSDDYRAKPNEIVLNTWTADDLGVKVGDEISITYYSVGADETYNTETASFLLKGIVPIEGIAADRGIIPEFPGIHDTADMSEWESPFPIDYTLIRSQDETYWDEYGPTPKAFISLETGKRLWQNRFGDLTTIRMKVPQGSDVQATRTLFETQFLKRIQPEQIGFQFLALQTEGLQAATGATDFGMLFSSLSILIILAVAWLVELFFRIGVEQRSHEIGILQAVGYPLAKIRRRFFLEGGSVAGIGTLLGCLLAIGYAQLMLFGLKTWWLPAIGTPFIAFHASLWSLLIGVCVTMVVMLNAIRVAVARIGRTSTATLLAGGADFDDAGVKPKSQETKTAGGLISKITFLGLGIWFGIIAGSHLFDDGWFGLIPLVLILAIILFSIRYGLHKAEGIYAHLTRQHINSMFLFCCIGVVIGVIIGYFPLVQWIRETVFSWFEHPVVQFLFSTLSILGVGWLAFSRWLASENVPKRFSRMRFAIKNAARQPQRSKVSVTTVSLACCIIVAVGANRHDAPPKTEYAFVAESALPLHHSLNTPDGRFELGFSDAASELLSASEIIPFRVLPGEDVSCLNLYQPQKPQILGASGAMLVKPPWQRLELSDLGEGRAPAMGDDNSLRWILHHNPDDDFLVQDEFGKPLLLDIETLQGSLFQSQLIISEANFTKYFPSQSGYQFFLIKTPPELREETAQVLEKTLGDYGFDLTSASARLASYRSVENTYISTFQSLGGLGVLLGTFGLALVLFRNIIERRGELATLRAFGFSRRLLSRMLFLESCFLLTVGMFIGIVAGLVAILATHGHFPAFPWISLTITLLFIFGFGIIANAVAVTIALRSPLLATLKSE